MKVTVTRKDEHLKKDVLEQFEVEKVPAFLTRGTLCRDLHDSRDGNRLEFLGYYVTKNNLDTEKVPFVDPDYSMYSVYRKVNEPIAESRKVNLARLKGYKNGEYEDFQVLVVVDYQKTKKRMRQVRDALNKCKNIELVEKCAKILGV